MVASALVFVFGPADLVAVLRGARVVLAAPAVFLVAVFKLGFSVDSSVSGWALADLAAPAEAVERRDAVRAAATYALSLLITGNVRHVDA
ncbi:hypothetical protein JCM33774_61940 [Actinophytocola sp. KF-1]